MLLYIEAITSKRKSRFVNEALVSKHRRNLPAEVLDCREMLPGSKRVKDKTIGSESPLQKWRLLKLKNGIFKYGW